MRRRILIVNRQLELDGFLRLCFRPDDSQVLIASSPAASLVPLVKHNPQVLVLSESLPSLESPYFVRLVHRLGVPVLSLSPNADADRTRDAALRVDADDYVLAPYRPAELRERVGLLARAADAWRLKSEGDRRTDLELVGPSGARRLAGDWRNSLGPIELAVVSFLLLNHGRVVLRSEVLAAVWGDATLEAASQLDFTLARLQSKTGLDPTLLKYTAPEEEPAGILPVSLIAAGAEVAHE